MDALGDMPAEDLLVTGRQPRRSPLWSWLFTQGLWPSLERQLSPSTKASGSQSRLIYTWLPVCQTTLECIMDGIEQDGEGDAPAHRVSGDTTSFCPHQDSDSLTFPVVLSYGTHSTTRLL